MLDPVPFQHEYSFCEVVVENEGNHLAMADEDWHESPSSASPRPPSPSFVIKVPSRISSRPGTFELVFYVPDEYRSAPPEQRFPVVVNYHGGGFTLGTGQTMPAGHNRS